MTAQSDEAQGAHCMSGTLCPFHRDRRHILNPSDVSHLCNRADRSFDSDVTPYSISFNFYSGFFSDLELKPTHSRSLTQELFATTFKLLNRYFSGRYVSRAFWASSRVRNLNTPRG